MSRRTLAEQLFDLGLGGAFHSIRHVGRNAFIRRLILRDGVNCWICGFPVLLDGWPRHGEVIRIHRRRPSVDHVVPQSEGGSDEPDNLRIAHVYCNNKRQSRPMSQWLKEGCQSHMVDHYPDWLRSQGVDVGALTIQLRRVPRFTTLARWQNRNLRILAGRELEENGWILGSRGLGRMPQSYGTPFR